MGVNRLHNALAALWGFAEATLFFIVPDVLLSWLGLRSQRSALVASAYALIGALLGGWLMYRWAVQDFAGIRAWVLSLPGVSPQLLELARQQLHDIGVLALFKGGFGGVPYKTYAIHAAAEGVELAWFLTASVAARWLRFVLVMVLTRQLLLHLLPHHSLSVQRCWLLAGWLVFYAIYFTWLTP